MPLPPPLDTTIDPGQLGHDTDHEYLHQRINDLFKGLPFVDITHSDFTGGTNPTRATTQAAIDWAIANGYGVRHPDGVTVVMDLTPLVSTNGLIYLGEGDGSLFTSNAPAVAGAAAFAFWQSDNWAGAAECYNIELGRFRTRRTTTSWPAPDLSAFDCSVRIRNAVEGTGKRIPNVHDITMEGGFTGLVTEACQVGDFRRLRGRHQIDATIRTAENGAAGKDLTFREIRSINAGYVLDTTTAGAAGAGSAFLATQSGQRWIDCTAVNPRFRGFESADAAKRLYIVGYRGYCDIVNGGAGAERDASIVIADSADVEVDATFETHNGGLGRVIVAGTIGAAGNTIGQSNIRIRLRHTNDYFANGYELKAVEITGSCSDVTLEDFDVTGAHVWIGATSGVIRVRDGRVRGAAQRGLYLATGVFDLQRVHAFNCGADTSIGAVNERCGIQMENWAAGSVAADCDAYDTRAGGARTQRTGYYRINSTGTWDRMRASNNISADKADAGGASTFAAPTFVAA